MNNNYNKRFKIDYEYNNNRCNNNNDENQNQNEILLKRKANNRSQIENNNLQNQNIESNNINIIKDTLIYNNIVTLNNNSDSDNNSCNKVFNNIYIRKIIFNHLNKFNILYPVNIKFKSVEKFQKFKYKEYLHRVTLDFKNEADKFELNQLPHNIKHLTIIPPNLKKYGNYEIISVPDHIESVSYFNSVKTNYVNSLQQQPYSSKIKTLYINKKVYEKILPNRIPHSVTDLEISTYRLSNNILPSNLKKLTINDLESFEDNCLQIESLTHLRIYYSTPLILHQLSRSFFKNLLKLEIINKDSTIDSNIQFPDSLKELIIKCGGFRNMSSNKLKSKQSTDKCCQFQFPPLSLKKLSILFYKEYDDIYFKSLPPNLKSLEFQCSSIIDNKGQSILPSKLETLLIKDPLNQVLQVNQLPSTLTYLDLGSEFDEVIDINVLPSNLDTLILGHKYSQVINPLAIPQQLKLLEIKNINYSYPINLTPSTHPNTAISLKGYNINLYYQAKSSDYNQIRVLRLPDYFDSPFSTLQLQNKSNLEYLHLGFFFNRPIKLSDLPTQNNIKTLDLGVFYDYTMNLEFFQNLETIIINESHPTIITTTTTIIDDQQQQYLHYNNYKLKNIIVSPKHIKFLKQLDINFYQFIKYSDNKYNKFN